MPGYLRNFPDTQAFEKFPRYPGIWEIPIFDIFDNCCHSLKGKLINEIVNYDLDILCAQEVETEAFVTFFRDQLSNHDYDSLFYPKGRAKTMGSNYNQVDGCATFWKKSRFNMISNVITLLYNS